MRKIIWRDIPGFGGRYQVSNTGLIRNSGGLIHHPAVNSGGYLTVYLRPQPRGPKFGYKVHRLVAMAFIPNPLNLPEINHKDCNPKNNNVKNLEWCNRIYNNNFKRGLHLEAKNSVQCFGNGVFFEEPLW